MSKENIEKSTRWFKSMFVLLVLISVAQHSTAQKNVLFLMADDFNYWTSKDGYYPYAKTPNLDKLANMGVFFREAHCSSPVCNPSRNAIWSGLRPSTTGIDGNDDPYVREVNGFEDIVTMNQYFMQNGYWVYGAGKLYHPKMSKSNHETDPENWSYINENGHGCNGGAVYKFCNSAKNNYCFSANSDAMSRSNCGDFNLANDVKEVLENYASSPQKDKPFFIGCGVFRPHMPWNSPLSFWDLFNYDALVKPAAYNPELDDPGNSIHRDFVDYGQWMRAIQGYLASCALADYNVGIMVDALMASPYKDNTIIVFCGDHGWNLGEKGRWGKFDRCDEANHTSLIIYDPSSTGNGEECIKPVSLQDLYPTLIDLCDLPERKNVEGNSLKPLLDDPDDPNVNSFALMMYGDVHYIKTEKWRFIDDGNESLLHNNIDDPYQWNNLYGNAAYNNLVDSLRHKIDSVIAIGTEVKNHYFEYMPPIRPDNLEVIPINDHSLKISWNDNANNEMGYHLYRQLNGEGEFDLYQQLPINSSNFIDNDVTTNNTYAYFIEVYNQVDTLASSVVSGIRPQNVAPVAPSNLMAVPISIQQIDLMWNDNSLNETKFKVYRKENDERTYQNIVSLNANTTSYSDKTVEAPKIYSYYVEAVNEAGATTSNTVENIQPIDNTYNGVAYEGTPWTMPATSVMAWMYDKVGEGNSWLADSSVTIGVFNASNEGAGQDIRSYGNCPYSGARWNGGSNTMRENGHWMRYTCTFEEGSYRLKIRGRNLSKTIKLTLKTAVGLMDVYQKSFHYPADFQNVGEGGDNSGVTYWYLGNEDIAIDQGTYVVEIELNDASGQGVFGAFSFEKSKPTRTRNIIKQEKRVLLNNKIDEGYLHLDLTKMNPAVWLKVVDLKGKVVYEKVVGGEDVVTIELDSAMSKGMYLLQIDDSDRKLSEKFYVN